MTGRIFIEYPTNHSDLIVFCNAHQASFSSLHKKKKKEKKEKENVTLPARTRIVEFLTHALTLASRHDHTFAAISRDKSRLTSSSFPRRLISRVAHVRRFTHIIHGSAGFAKLERRIRSDEERGVRLIRPARRQVILSGYPRSRDHASRSVIDAFEPFQAGRPSRVGFHETALSFFVVLYPTLLLSRSVRGQRRVWVTR